MTGEVVAPRRKPLMFCGFIALMLALMVLFIGLGKWQLDRLAWKEGLIADVADRMHQPPVKLPPAAEWVGFDPDTYQFRQITVTGHFIHDQAVRVFTSLSDAKGKYAGAGYWIMTPFALDGGGTVFVNRGFVPQQVAATYIDDKAGPMGEQTLTGIGLESEAAGGFTPGPDGPNRIEWVRDISRLKAMDDQTLAPVLSLFIDLPATAPGALPQGGETTVDFPNNHLGYAWTWFGFALITPIMLVFWIVRQRQPRAKKG